MATGKFGKSAKSRQDTAVQGTNDNSIVSKFSAASLNYFTDDFLKYFVAKKVRRSPLLNRGYYVRAKAIQRAFDTFLVDDHNKQVVSLGAGFDSAYWRLKKSGQLENVTYIEIDFIDVAKRKAELIKSKPVLNEILGDYDETSVAPNIIINSKDYKLLGVDLCKLELLKSTLESCSIDFNIPTMFLSEVVLTYMAPKHVNNLLKWVCASFPNSIFVTYEQIQPFDSFGSVMIKHFKKLGSELKNIANYPTKEAQIQRYIDSGWKACQAVDINEFVYTLIPVEERTRMLQLEPFDEYEEFHCKCAHYILLTASSDSTSDYVPRILDQKETSTKIVTTQKPECVKVLDFENFLDSNCWNQRFGHCCVQLKNTVISIGGFGSDRGSHKRVTYPTLINHNSFNSILNNELTCAFQNPNPLFERMYASVTRIGPDKALVYGGRISPKKCCSTILEIEISEFCTSSDHQITTEQGNQTPNDSIILNFRQLKVEGEIPSDRWRHSANFHKILGREFVIIFGGRNEKAVFGDCFYLDLENLIWKNRKILNEVELARHSHSASIWRDKLVIAGGLNSVEQIHENIVLLSLVSNETTKLSLKGTQTLIPRYSHSATVCGDKLILLGGVTIVPEVTPGVSVINLLTGTAVEFSLPPAEPERPLLLHSHQSVMVKEGIFLVIGGGGNCFSFGTHLNSDPILIDCTECLL